MIYVIQEKTYDAKPVYAGSSAHEALLAASALEACKITLFKNGKKYAVHSIKPQPT